MNELATSINRRYTTCIQRYPNGRYGIVGAIPVELTKNGSSLIWDTEEDVVDALLAAGCYTFQLSDCSWYQY